MQVGERSPSCPESYLLECWHFRDMTVLGDKRFLSQRGREKIYNSKFSKVTPLRGDSGS